MHRRAGPVVELVALGRTGAGERPPDACELAGPEAPLPLFPRRRPSRPAPLLGALLRGIPRLRPWMVIRRAIPLAVPVPQIPAAVKGVPGLPAVFPVLAVPPAVVPVPGVQMRGK